MLSEIQFGRNNPYICFLLLNPRCKEQMYGLFRPIPEILCITISHVVSFIAQMQVN